MPETPTGGAHSESNGDKNVTIADIINQDKTPPLPELCFRIHERVEAFLNAPPESERMRSVQKQSRESLGVIEGALSSYRYGYTKQQRSEPKNYRLKQKV